MKLLLVVVLVSVAVQSSWAYADVPEGVFASMETAIAQATGTYETFLGATSNGIATIL